jgi:hypothetical protein
MEEYLLKDWKEVTKEDIECHDLSKLKIRIITETEMWELLQNKEKGISIYKIGNCLIDWP